ncbi:MAG: hypothetical protein EP335_13795 [Alphaproteobacteria bacterium]|nr:MAG: hypothetical protein EP335_13795 [Alphaproteobacteria bacterium]
MRTFHFISATFAAALSIGANAATPQPTACETDPGFRAFDFWLGDWSVSSSKSGKYAGENHIKAIEGGCAISEDWHGQGGSTGKSVNYYNPVTGKWRQVWVAAGAYSLDIEGGLKDGSMVLEGTIWYYSTGGAVPFRGTWTPNADGSVRQFFEQYDAEKKQWQPWFDGHYVKASQDN